MISCQFFFSPKQYPIKENRRKTAELINVIKIARIE
jgi:hypothetical protein